MSNIENTPVTLGDAGETPNGCDGEPIKSTTETDPATGHVIVEVDEYADGSVIRRDAKTGRYLPGTISKAGKNKKPYEFWAIANKVRDGKSLARIVARLYETAMTSRDPKIMMEAARDIARLEGWLKQQQEVDISIKKDNWDEVNNVIKNIFGLNNDTKP